VSRIAVVLGVLLAVLVPVPGRAIYHFANIDEIMSGMGGDSTAQYVEIRMLFGGQGSVAHSRLTAFSCDGSTHAILLEVPDDVCPANIDGRWTMGTTSWATATGVTPDFIFPASPAFGNACGMICWGAPGSGLVAPENPPTWDAGMPANYNPDCVAYGGYTGTRQTGDAAASALAAGNGTMSLQRMADNGNDSTDFALATPTPASNGVCATTTSTTVTTTSLPPGTTTTTGAVATSTTATTSTTGAAGTSTTVTTTTGAAGTSTTATTTTATVITSTTVTTTSLPPGGGQPIAGTRLLLKGNPTKPAKNVLVLVAKDTAIQLSDPTQLGGMLQVFTQAGDRFDTRYPLTASRWKRIGKPGAPKGYRFTDAAGPIRSVIVKQAKIAKVLGKGAGLGHTLAANPDPVTVLLAVGTQRDCMSFGGGKFVAGKKYLATNDPPPAACP